MMMGHLCPQALRGWIVLLQIGEVGLFPSHTPKTTIGFLCEKFFCVLHGNSYGPIAWPRSLALVSIQQHRTSPHTAGGRDARVGIG